MQINGPVGFVGLGNLAGRMAARLLDGGVKLVSLIPTCNRRKCSPASTPRRPSAHRARSPRRPRYIFSCLPSTEAAQQALLGDDGVASAVREASAVVECSTVSPDTAERLANGLRAQGAAVIDASVSGRTIPAEQGELVLLVGGDRELYDRCEPLFEHLAKATFFMGASGAGARTKLVVNTMLGVAMQGLAEAWALGLGAGLDRDDLAEVLSRSDTVPGPISPRSRTSPAGSSRPNSRCA